MNINKIDKRLDRLLTLWNKFRKIKPIKEILANKINYYLYLKNKEKEKRRLCLMKKKRNGQENKEKKFQ